MENLMPKGANNSYFGNIAEGVQSWLHGMKLTLRHLLKAHKRIPNLSISDPDYFKHTEGIFTNRYPHEPLPVPDNGRYQLHNEIDDCIVCDKCAKICPVDCIEIEPIRATEEIGKTSDGTTKRIYAAKFDIDMGKCCFCGLCTTVCPTECLTMTKAYDYSSFDIHEHQFAFAEMTPLEILEAKEKLEKQQIAKAAAAAEQKTKNDTTSDIKPKPSFKPKIKAPNLTSEEPKNKAEDTAKPSKAVFKPKMKPIIKPKAEETENDEKKEHKVNKPKPVFNPKPMSPKKKKGGEEDAD